MMTAAWRDVYKTD